MLCDICGTGLTEREMFHGILCGNCIEDLEQDQKEYYQELEDFLNSERMMSAGDAGIKHYNQTRGRLER